MRQPKTNSLAREALKPRQREIAERLAAHGLAGGRRALHLVREASGEGDRSRRLSNALAELGPVFSAFGLYLSTRVDLLPVKDCLALAEIPDRAPANRLLRGMPLRDLLERELRCDVARVFSACEARPRRAELLFQVHHARLLDGAVVEVRVRHGAVEQDFARDAELLPLLQNALDCEREREFPLEEAIADFRRAWQQQCDLPRSADLMIEYAREAAMYDWLRAPLVHRWLCTPRLMIVERFPGVSLAELMAQSGGPESFEARDADEMAVANAAADFSGTDARHLASRLCQVWLRQALEGRLFPVSPRASEIVLLPDQQFAFTGAGFATLPSEAQTNLRDYLVAASTQDFDRACACLLRETNRSAGSDSEDVLCRRLRQLVPFRDGGWGRRGGKETLAEHLFLHCRLAAGCGYSLRCRSREFFGGLFFVAAAAQLLAPMHDPLQEGLEDLRVNATLAQFRELLGLRQIGENADRYAAVLMELPKRLDQTLTIASGGRAHLNAGGAVADAPRSRESLPSVVVALMLLLVTAVLLSRHFSSAGARVWADKAGAIVFVAVGALLLWVVSRRK